MRAPRLAVAALAALALAALLLPAAAGAAEPRVNITEIEGEVMCPVCGTLLELAESPQAQREKVFLKGLVEEGKSKSEIKDALVAEYGDEVLALPQDSGFSLSAYVVPIVAFAIAAIALALGVLGWRRSSRGGGPGGTPRGPSASDSDRLDADLAKYDL